MQADRSAHLPVGDVTFLEPAERSAVWDFAEVVLRRWRLVMLSALVVAGATWLSARNRAATYTAAVLISVGSTEQVPGVIGVAPAVLNQPDQSASAQEVIRSFGVLSQVVDSLRLQMTLGGTPILEQDLFGDVRVAPDAPLGSYVVTAVRGRFILSAKSGGRPMAEAGPGEGLGGPGFHLQVLRPAALTAPLALSVTSRVAATLRLQNDLKIEQVKGTSFLRIRYTSRDRQLAAAVPNAVAGAYREYTIGRAREESIRRRDMIASQLKDLSDSLSAAQGILQRFQEATRTLDPHVDAAQLTAALLTVQGEVRRLRLQQGMLQDVLTTLQSPGTEEDGLRRAAALSRDLVPAADEIYRRLQDLAQERRRLTVSRFGYTMGAPRVELLDSLIAGSRSDVIATIGQSLALLRSQLDSARAHESDLAAQIGHLPQESAEFSRLTQHVAAVRTLFDALLGQYYQEQVSEAAQRGSADVIDAARVPLTPDLSGRRLVPLALLLGLVIGSLGAVAMDHLNPSVSRHAEIERLTHSEIVGQIPMVAQRVGAARAAARAAVAADRHSPAAEAFRDLRTALRLEGNGGLRTISITSSGVGEGKTTVVSSLGAMLGQDGVRVLILDADLRRPTIHQVFLTKRSPGVTDVLGGSATLDSAVVATGVAGVSILPSGTHVETPAELLGTQAFRELVRSAAGVFDIVLIDSPPALAVTDPVLVADAVDGVLVVAVPNRTNRYALHGTVEKLRRSGAAVRGIVLNMVPTGGLYQYGRGEYGYYASYHGAESDGGGHAVRQWGRSLVTRLFRR